MRIVVFALAALSACFLQEVSGLVLGITPKKEVKVELNEDRQEAQLHRGEAALKQLKDPVILAAVQEIYARADELIVKASKPGASEADKKAEAQIAEDLHLAEEALQTKADGTLSDSDEQHDEQDEKDKEEGSVE